MPPFDREGALKSAEKALKLGRIDAAIAEYVKIVEAQPRDWNSANALGDLYVRAGQTDKGIGHYVRIADHLDTEGFYPKAASPLQEDPEDQARRRGRAAATGRNRRPAGPAGRRQAVLQSTLRPAQEAGRPQGRRRAHRPHRHAGSRRPRRPPRGGASRGQHGRSRHRAPRVPGRGASLRRGEPHRRADRRARRHRRSRPLRRGVRLQGRAGDGGRGRPAAGAAHTCPIATAGTDAGLLLALAEVRLAANQLDEGRAAIARAIRVEPGSARRRGGVWGAAWPKPRPKPDIR